LQFNLKQMPQAAIVEHLTTVLNAEAITFEPTALRHLAKGAAGSMRDALSLLDQAIAHGAGTVTEEGVRAMLGTVGDEHLFALLDGLVAGDVHALLAVAREMDARSLSFDAGLQELATLLHRVALAQFAPEALLDAAERERLVAYAAVLDAEFLQLAYQIAVHGRDELALAPDEYAGFVMTLLRLHAFRPERAAAGQAAPGGQPVARPAMPTMPDRASRTSSPAAVAATSVAPPSAARPATASSAATTAVPPTPTFSAPDAVNASVNAPTKADKNIVANDNRAVADWPTLLSRLQLTGMARQLAQHCELAEVTDTAVSLRLAPTHKHLLGKAQQDKLQAELQTHFGRPLRLDIAVAEPAGATPAARARDAQRERQERAIAAIEQDPFVREVIDLFDASIDESTIKPLKE
jgi:DNA polymerase-3 subunit gamma/tau